MLSVREAVLDIVTLLLTNLSWLLLFWGLCICATREESGVLGFPSRRGLTPRGSLECNPEIPAFPGEEN